MLVRTAHNGLLTLGELIGFCRDAHAAGCPIDQPIQAQPASMLPDAGPDWLTTVMIPEPTTTSGTAAATGAAAAASPLTPEDR